LINLKKDWLANQIYGAKLIFCTHINKLAFSIKKTEMDSIRIVIILVLTYLTYQILIAIYLIKSEKKRIEKREKYFGLAFLITLVLGLSYFKKEDVILGLQLGLFLTIFMGFLILITRLIIKISEMFSKHPQRIEGLNSVGFKIAKGTNLKQYYWREIQWISFDKEKFRLILKHKHRILIDEKAHNFYLLLKNIPLGYKDFDYTFITSFFSNLTTCVVCGAIAFNDSKCLYCGCTTWTNELEKDYLNYEEYVKANQLEIFATLEKNEKFCDFKIIDKNFEFDSNWTPMVTKKEVLEFSEKEYWEKE